MRTSERRMLDIVRKGHEHYNFDALKAEFEAEGTRTDEFLRLLEVARRAGVKVGLKIGGCEAVRDLYEARQFGVDYIIAPMIETPYALSKYIEAKNMVYTAEERRDVGFLFNIETITAYNSLDDIMKVASGPNGVDGAVFGRVDFSGSMGLGRDVIDGEQITKHVCGVAVQAKSRGVDLVVGGGVSTSSVEALRQVRDIRLDRFETRKVIFDASVLDGRKIEAALLLAIEFELLWLTNKRDYYQRISVEDQKRISMLEARISAADAGSDRKAV